MATGPTQSAEDYLERIHELIQHKGRARVMDIATSLNVTRASVTNMIQRLGEQGYLEYVRYRGVVLTPRGREVALRVRRRHATLSRFFSLLGLDEAVQQRDIEGIEHHLSADTLAALVDLTRFFEENPAVLDRFRHSRAGRDGKSPSA
ncbi:MAG: transcriptional regulator MntR [Verrucomicrobia bacterium]|nr:MAG: transcriptional regulator MntR [Verrucomicrobiota bacterium]